ncbi:MAG: DUF6293 family protein [Thermoplasmata archaeon]|nr:DUF6293 family protein [Thermoplasmata archaeon]
MTRPRTARPTLSARAPGIPVGDAHARIHIAAVGFEVERVVDPILRERADRAYLLTKGHDDAARPFVDEVVRRLHAADRSLEVRVESTEIWDVFGSLGMFRRIFEREGRSDRRDGAVVPIRVNVSTGTKITAIAGTLACMLWRGEPYYVQVSKSWYSGRNPKVRAVNDVVARIDPVGIYELRAPAKELVEILEALGRRGGALRKRDLIHELGMDRPIAGGDASRTPTPQSQHSRLRRRLEPLEGRWGFVEADPGGRGRVRLTPQGRLALGLFGASAPDPPDTPIHRLNPFNR